MKRRRPRIHQSMRTKRKASRAQRCRELRFPNGSTILVGGHARLTSGSWDGLGVRFQGVSLLHEPNMETMDA